MFNTLLQKVKQFSKSALSIMVRGSGTAALYLCTSTFLAAILLAGYLIYNYGIDKERAYKAVAILMGHDISAAQQATLDRIAETSRDDIIERRAQRLLEDEFIREVRQPAVSLPLPPEDQKPEPPPPGPSDVDMISAYQKRVQDDLARARTAGRDEMTRLLEDKGMDVEQAKEVIRKFWKDGFKDLVLATLLDMADKRRGEILYSFNQDNAEELKDLNEILKDISDGKPMASIIENAARDVQ